MTNDFSTLKTNLDDSGILTITLNRPDKLNALSEQLLDELHQIIQHSKTDSNVKALLLTGEGKAFCAGADIKRLAELNSQTGYVFAKHGQKIFRELELLGKPSLAAINGYAFGGGCELALAAHMRIASNTAQFAQPEVKLGIMPGYGATQRLGRVVGKGRCIDLCITGRVIRAEDALNWGLVSEVTEPEQLLDKAKQILGGILQQASLAVTHTLDVIERGYDMPIEDAMHLEASLFALCCGSEDKHEGVNAFLSKRQPTFKGE